MISQRVPGGVVHPLPADLRDTLIASGTALDAWNDITPLARNEFICWVEDAKQQKTRERRIRRTREELEEGQRRPCCWPGCKHRNRNVEIVRAMLDTWNTRGIFETVDAFHPDVELVDLQAAMGMQGRGRGPAELHRMSEQWTEIFDDWGLDVLDVVDLGDDLVMAEVHFDGVGRDSGAPVSLTQFEVYRLRDGKIAEIRVGFQDRAEALDWSRR